jgi:hypothetical protein
MRPRDIVDRPILQEHLLLARRPGRHCALGSDPADRAPGTIGPGAPSLSSRGRSCGSVAGSDRPAGRRSLGVDPERRCQPRHPIQRQASLALLQLVDLWRGRADTVGQSLHAEAGQIAEFSESVRHHVRIYIRIGYGRQDRKRKIFPAILVAGIRNKTSTNCVSICPKWRQQCPLCPTCRTIRRAERR